MAKKPTYKTLDKIKTGRWQRQWSVAKAGMSAGTGTATQMLGTAFLSKEHRQEKAGEPQNPDAGHLGDI